MSSQFPEVFKFYHFLIKHTIIWNKENFFSHFHLELLYFINIFYSSFLFTDLSMSINSFVQVF